MSDFDNNINETEYMKSGLDRVHNNSCRRIKELINDTKGFTLVELIVVLVIIAILAAAVGPAFLGYIDKAKKNGTLNDAKKVYLAAQSLSEQAHSDLVNPALRVTEDRLSELTDIKNIKVNGSGFPNCKITYKETFNDNNPSNNMYIIHSFEYSDGSFKAVYKKDSSDTEDIWTVTAY